MFESLKPYHLTIPNVSIIFGKFMLFNITFLYMYGKRACDGDIFDIISLNNNSSAPNMEIVYRMYKVYAL